MVTEVYGSSYAEVSIVRAKKVGWIPKKAAGISFLINGFPASEKTESGQMGWI